MCCFSPVSPPAGLLAWLRPARPLRVEETRIFARRDGPRQLLAYQMRLEVGGEVAMILPLPVAAGHGDDALRFIDLSDYARLFEDLARPFLVPQPASRSKGGPQALAAPLPVVEVGSFEASFVPSVQDFDRLDPRFRLPTEVWGAVPAVAGFGFAVFKLKAGARRIHPMALSFVRPDTERLFFPTLHVHDGTVHATADFDHVLYWQGDAAASDQRSATPVGAFVDMTRCAGLVDAAAPVCRRELRGRMPNADTWI